MKKYGKKDDSHKSIMRDIETLIDMGVVTCIDLSTVGNDKPDAIFGANGRDCIVEFKTGNGKLKPGQAAFIDSWRGCPVRVVRTTKELLYWFDKDLGCRL